MDRNTPIEDAGFDDIAFRELSECGLLACNNRLETLGDIADYCNAPAPPKGFPKTARLLNIKGLSSYTVGKIKKKLHAAKLI